MTTREEVADLLYRNQYPDPASPGIQPLAERAQWEQEMIYRGADAVMGLLEKTWDEGAEAMCGQDNGGPMAYNPYTAQTEVDGL